MSDQPKDGGPAFPSDPTHVRMTGSGEVEPLGHRGMTLRDYFAAKALAAIVSNQEYKDLGSLEAAKWAYELAADMLAERAAIV